MYCVLRILVSTDNKYSRTGQEFIQVMEALLSSCSSLQHLQVLWTINAYDRQLKPQG